MGPGSGAGVRALGCTLAMGIVLSSAAGARADNPKVNVDTFRPSVHPGDLLGVLTASQGDILDFGAGAWLTLNSRPLRLDVQKPFDWVAWQLVADVYGWFNLFGVVDIGVDLPVSLFNHGDAPTVASERILLGLDLRTKTA